MKFDVVGSFLPPDTLVNARREMARGLASEGFLDGIVDASIAEIVDLQIESGLNTVTSGELRRQSWDHDFYFGLNGIRREHVDSGHLFQDVSLMTDMPRFTERITFNPNHPFFADFKYLRQTVAGRAKCRQTIPSPADLYLEILAMTDGEPSRIYSSAETLLGDIATAYRETILGFYDLGCRDIQIDDTACGRLADPSVVKRLIQGGVDFIGLHNDIIALLNASIQDLPSDFTTSIYISAGQQIVPDWDAQERPDNLLPKLLKEATFDRFYLPFESRHAEKIAVLAHVPAGKEVVLGLISAHTPFPDSSVDIVRAVSFAEKFIPRNRLAISPSSGFKLSSYEMRGLGFNDQWNKLGSLAKLVANL